MPRIAALDQDARRFRPRSLLPLEFWRKITSAAGSQNKVNFNISKTQILQWVRGISCLGCKAGLQVVRMTVICGH